MFVYMFIIWEFLLTGYTMSCQCKWLVIVREHSHIES